MEQMAALRAEWFVQLTYAIESAQRLAWQLGRNQRISTEARQLYGRLEVVRLELDSLRGLARRSHISVDPIWLQKLGWGEPASDPAD